MKYSYEQSAVQAMLGDDRITLKEYWQPVPVPILLTTSVKLLTVYVEYSTLLICIIYI